MSKLPMGPVNRHIQKSTGGDSDVMKFYCTQNATTYGQKFVKFQPRMGKHTGTGYQSNFRPGVYYNNQLDTLDNPVLGDICSKNYKSVTIRDYVPYEGPSGREPLPNTCHQAGSGYIRQDPLSIPTDADVRNVAINTRTASAPVDLPPRYKPHLHKLRPKDPVELENKGYGPSYMSTETQQKFQGQQRPEASLRGKSVGGKEESGFTHNHNVEPVTFNPDQAHLNDGPAFLTSRPTGISVSKTHFQPSKYPNGTEPLPRIANCSEHNTGFTTSTKSKPEFACRQPTDAFDKADDMPRAQLENTRKNDPSEYLNTQNPNNYSSVTKLTFRGIQRPIPNEADRLGRTGVGSKEDTGFTENNDRFVQTADNPARFVTHYMTRFMDRSPVGVDTEGHTWGGILPHQKDGFTKSTNTHSYGPDIDSTQQLRNMEPYVARSVRARDPFFDDHIHDNKKYSAVPPSAMPVC